MADPSNGNFKNNTVLVLKEIMDEEVILGPLLKDSSQQEVEPLVGLNCRRAAGNAATKQGGPS
jgi:hypothetical protein